MFWKAFLIAFFTWLSGGLFSLTLGWSLYMGAPLMGGLIVGAILGDVSYGVQVGAAIQMAYIGYIAAGGAMPSDLALAGYLAVALTMLSNATPEVGVTIAVTLGFLGLLVRNGKMTLNSIWVHKADKYAEEGNIKGIKLMNIGASQIVPFIGYFIPTFLAVYFGGEYLEGLLNAIPEFLLKGLQVVGSLLPALGLAMLLKVIGKRSFMPFFFIGFVFTAYLGLDLIALVILGICFALLHMYYSGKEEGVKSE